MEHKTVEQKTFTQYQNKSICCFMLFLKVKTNKKKIGENEEEIRLPTRTPGIPNLGTVNNEESYTEPMREKFDSDGKAVGGIEASVVKYGKIMVYTLF